MGGDLTSPACQTSQDGLQEFPHPAGGVAVLEEDCGVRVFLGSRVVDDLGEVGGELFVLGRPSLDIGSWTAGFVNRS